MYKLSRRLFDALTTSIPLIVMGLLAVATWWLVVLTPEPPSVVQNKPVREDADLIVTDFIAERFDSSGTLRSNLKGDLAQQFTATHTIVVSPVDLMTTESSDSREKVQPVLGTPGVEFFKITAVSEKGIIYNDDSVVELLDNAYVTRQPLGTLGQKDKAEFRGDELKILMDENKMVSDKPVDITQNGTRFIAEKMVYNNATDILNMDGRVVGVIVEQP